MNCDKARDLRLQQAKAWIKAGEKFDNVLFTGESTFATQTAKSPLKLHVWGAISRQGPGPLLIFKGELYSKPTLQEVVKK